MNWNGLPCTAVHNFANLLWSCWLHCTVIAFEYAEMLDLALLQVDRILHSTCTVTELNWTLNCVEPPVNPAVGRAAHRFCVQIPIIFPCLRHLPTSTAGHWFTTYCNLHCVSSWYCFAEISLHCSILTGSVGTLERTNTQFSHFSPASCTARTFCTVQCAYKIALPGIIGAPLPVHYCTAQLLQSSQTESRDSLLGSQIGIFIWLGQLPPTSKCVTNI